MKETTTTAVEREKAANVTVTSDSIKVIVKYPESVSDVIRQEKINHIYDILTRHKSE